MEERPIDRGWAWVICFAVAVNTMFFSGPLRSYGILFVEIRRRFNTSGTATSMVLAMISVGMAITSPGAATLGERYGQRKILVVGATLMGLAAFLTAFAPNVIYVAIVFGGLTGLGLGCVFTPSVTMIGYYFDKRRSLANGISSAGGSIGQLTIPLLFTYLMEEYSFQGGLLIFSALLLHVIPASLLIRPVTEYLPVTKKEQEGDKDKEKGAQENEENGVDIDNVQFKPTKEGSDGNKVVITTEPKPNSNGSNAADKHPEASTTKSSVPLLRIHKLETENEDTKSLHSFPSHLRDSKPSNLSKSMGNSMPFLHRLKSHDHVDGDEIALENRGSSYFLPEQPLTPLGNEHVSLHHNSTNNTHMHTNTNAEDADDLRTYDVDDEDDLVKKRGTCATILCFCCNLYNWEMFKDRVFILYCISMTLSQSGYMSVCMFLPPFAEEKNIPPYQIALLLSIAGFVTLFGRIGGGWFADLKLIARPILSGICLIIVGIAAALLPLFPVYPYMVVYAVILGFIGGTFVALIISVVIDLLGIDRMTDAFGLSLMISGIVTIPLPLLLGMLKDVTGTFDWSIWLCSMLLFIGGGFTIFTQYYVKKHSLQVHS